MLQTVNCGWGFTDITPPGKMQLIGQFYKRIAESALDPLTATVLAIKPDNGKVVFWISFDLLGIGTDTTEMLASEISKYVDDFTRDRLICSCIHNHTGPYLHSDAFEGWGESYRVITSEDCISPEAYRNDYLVPRVTKACLEAYNSLQPCGIAPVLGHAVIGHPRRTHYRDGSSIMYGPSDTYNFDSLEGAHDNGIEMLYIYDRSMNLTGLVMNVNCPAQVLEHMSVYTADYIGYFRMKLNECLGHKLPVLALIGAAGNVSPRDMIRRGRGEGDLNSVEYAKDLAERLYCCFEYNLDKAVKSVKFENEFDYMYKSVPLLIRTVSANVLAQATAEYQYYLDKYDGDPLKFSQEDRANAASSAGIVGRGKRQLKSTLYYASVHVMRLGDCALVTNPFELYSEYGMRMRARAKAEHTFTVQLTDDYADYLPTKEAVEGGSYSTIVSNCLVSCDGGEMLTENSIEMINSMF